MKVSNATSSKRIGHCPACFDALYATVEFSVELRIPGALPPDTSAVNIQATTQIVGVGLAAHSCGTRPAPPVEDVQA